MTEMLFPEIDFAVHSLKDVPTELDPQFKITATLERAPTADLLIFDLEILHPITRYLSFRSLATRHRQGRFAFL